MIKFRAKAFTGKEVLGLALSVENMKRLMQRDPIFFDLQQLGIDLPEMHVLVMQADSQEQIEDNLDKMNQLMMTLDQEAKKRKDGGKKNGKPDRKN